MGSSLGSLGSAVTTGKASLAVTPPRCRQLNRLQNILVAGAAAEIPRKPLFDFFLVRVRVFVQQLVSRHEKPGRAKATLQSVFFAKRFLDRMELAAGLCQAFHGH